MRMFFISLIGNYNPLFSVEIYKEITLKCKREDERHICSVEESYDNVVIA